MIDALVSGPIGVILGWALAYVQGRRTDRRAERERLLAQMQQLVLAVADLDRARRIFDAAHVGRRTRAQVGLYAAAEFLAVWTAPGDRRRNAAAALAPVSRLVHDWERASMEGAGEVALAMSRVAAAGLPLGMVADTRIAEAAQRLMDAAIENRPQQAVERAVQELRWTFYPREAPPASQP